MPDDAIEVALTYSLALRLIVLPLALMAAGLVVGVPVALFAHPLHGTDWVYGPLSVIGVWAMFAPLLFATIVVWRRRHIRITASSIEIHDPIAFKGTWTLNRSTIESWARAFKNSRPDRLLGASGFEVSMVAVVNLREPTVPPIRIGPWLWIINNSRVRLASPRHAAKSLGLPSRTADGIPLFRALESHGWPTRPTS